MMRTIAVSFVAGATAFSATPGPAPINPCNPDGKSNIISAALKDTPCETLMKPQSGANVTHGSVGMLTADLQPIGLHNFSSLGMCAVNLHWHLGSEHFNAGTFDIPADVALAAILGHAPDAPAPGERPGYFCHDYDANNPAYTTEYHFEHCSEEMKVGYTYEMHWPSSNMGDCDTKWRMQEPFMDGVLCKATMAGMPPEAAVSAIFDSKVAKIGVQSMVFTVVNDPMYDYPEWDAMKGWNAALVTDAAVYQGSTTGDSANNEVCRASGGMVSWHVERGCHKISAKKFDQICEQMMQQADDMSADVHAHGSRTLVDPMYTSNLILDEKRA